MVKLFSFNQFVHLCLAAFLLASSSRLTAAAPQGRRGTAGVFMVIEGGRYTLDYSDASATCQRLNVTMATRGQMERALQEGLETCKFGWIAEQIAVIPRLISDERCGKGKTGLAAWHAQPDTKFAVFCYNASATQGLSETSTSPLEPTSSSSSTTTIPQTQTQAPVTPSVRSTHTPSSTSQPTTSPRQKPLALTITHPVKTTRPARKTPTATPTRRVVTTTPRVVSFTLSTDVHSSDFLTSSEPVLTQPVIITTENSLGAGPTALIILGVVVLLLMVSGAAWYHKLSVAQCGSRRLQKDDPETEMWKHADSEMDLHNQRGPEDEEEEESERKYSSEITLCVNPGIKANSSD